MACGFLLLFFGGLGSVPLLDPDEGRYAEIPREMLASRDFVTPHLDGVLYFEKPPLYYWLNAAATAALPSPEIASRLTGACFGLTGLGLVWLLGNAMGGRRTGLLAAIVLGTSPLYVALARAAIIDMVMTFFLSATLACFWFAQEQDEERRSRLLWYGAFLAAALATLAKGLIGIVIPGAVAFLFLLATRRWSVLRRVPWVGGPLLFLAIAAPWHVLAALRNPDFLWFYFVHEHVLRYATAEALRQQPFWFFGAILLVGLLPWSGLLPAVLALFRRSPERLRDRPALVFLLLWAGFVVLFFSASRSKLVPYILPALPPLAVLGALAVGEATEREGGARRWLRIGAAAGALFLGALILPFLWAPWARSRSFPPASRRSSLPSPCRPWRWPSPRRRSGGGGGRRRRGAPGGCRRWLERPSSSSDASGPWDPASGWTAAARSWRDFSSNGSGHRTRSTLTTATHNPCRSTSAA